MPGAGSQRDDLLDPRLAEPPRDVAAAGRDVERRACARGPLDDQVEVVAAAVRVATCGRRPRGRSQSIAHAASSTAARAASSIVGST